MCIREALARLGLRGISRKCASRFPGSALGNAAAGYFKGPDPASQTNRTNQSSSQSDSSFWDNFGKVGENNTVYNMDNQGSSDIQTRNAQKRTPEVQALIDYAGKHPEVMIRHLRDSSNDSVISTSKFGINNVYFHDSQGVGVPILGGFGDQDTENMLAAMKAFQEGPDKRPIKAINGLLTSITNMAAGGESNIEAMSPKDREAWFSKYQTFSQTPYKEYSVDITAWPPVTSQYVLGPSNGEKLINGFSLGFYPLGTSLGNLTGAVCVATDSSYSWDTRNQAAYDVGGNALAVPATAGIVLGGRSLLAGPMEGMATQSSSMMMRQLSRPVSDVALDITRSMPEPVWLANPSSLLFGDAPFLLSADMRMYIVPPGPRMGTTKAGATVALSVEDTLILRGDPARARIIQAIGEAAQPSIEAILKLDPDAKIGFRGSLADGLKNPTKLGPNGERVAFDGTVTTKNGAPYKGQQGYDADYFIVSDKLAAKIGNKNFFRDVIRADKSLSKTFVDFGRAMQENPLLNGMKHETPTFRVFTTKEIANKAAKNDAQIYFITRKKP